MRTTRLIRQNETIDLTNAGTVEIANVSDTAPVFVLTDEELADVDRIEELPLRNNVMNAMYRIMPGQRRTLAKAKYQIIIGVNAFAFVAYNGPIKVNGSSLN